ncbi:putative bifunctional diguanylate cyclase/phosphodiesterase [Sinorhizobium fredii]|uniref:Bifunctional diguanylate cyclase/phosphodiesterase n=1 Tax=Rhizobium fredii TaxID=380 RepID=A0A2A6LPZ5_RHIFR|nr:bifunctional diguanylate cyclase/phosphodiesterase [Sinorhizobium fredii]PDT44169.1 bifunctional diguanylate cyclase/phosphodiesterase [Sinorhizobium fredii]
MHSNAVRESRRTQLLVLLVAAVFILVAAALAGLVAGSIATLTTTADDIDDQRALQATSGAVHALRKQMAATLRDNAYWDDAYAEVNAETRIDWIIENWASTSADYPLYDTAIVVDSRNLPVVAYRKGVPMNVPPSVFFDDFHILLDAARRARMSDEVPVYFARSSAGTELIGAAAIQPFGSAESLDPGRFYVLVFAKLITPAVVAEVSDSFAIAGLRLDLKPTTGRLAVALKCVSSKDIAFFTWPSVAPGTKSYEKVDGHLRAAGTVLILFLCAIGVAGGLTVRNLRKSERASRHRALHDPLTGLLNRAGLLENVATASDWARLNGKQLRLHFIDLDGFKAVNDAWGHAVGDALIVAVSHRLLDALPDDAFAARLGGDEFAAVTLEELGAEAIPSFGRRLQEALASLFDIDGRSIEIGCSIGVAVSERGAVETGELIRRADIALYRAKDLGRGITIDFDDSFDDDALKQAELESQLRATLLKGGISVVFQPLINARSGAVTGVEALARWRKEDGIAIPPDVFIPLAERAGMIDLLGMQVLTTSLNAATAWPALGVGVNISPLQLKNPRFVEEVEAALKAADFEARRLTIEVTEGVLISNPEQARRAIEGLKKIGVKVALDDFGSGFASIGSLRRFGFDRMKVDRSLVAALDVDQNAGAVLQATVALANALEIPVTAEGIETEQQATAVRLSGCDELQGYLFSRPVSADAVTALYCGAEAGGRASQTGR